MRSIIVHIGGVAHAPIFYDWYNRAGELLADICWPEAFSLPGCLPWPAHVSLVPSLRKGKNFPPLETGLEAVQEAFGKAAASSCLVLSCPALYRWPEAMIRLRRELTARFPGAAVTIFLALVRQDMEMEARAGYGTLAFCVRNIPGIYARPPVGIAPYDQLLRETVALFGREAVHVAVHDSPEGAEKGFAADCARLFGLDSDPKRAQAARVLSPSPSLYFHGLPRELLAFLCAVHAGTLSEPRGGPAVFPWGRQAPRFASGKDWPLPRHSLYGPERHKEILDNHADSNARAAELLGLPRLFPEPAPEPDWEPWTGLTPESAYLVAERLEPEFRQTLLAALNPVRDPYLSREERIVRQALCDAETTRTTAPVLPAPQRPPAEAAGMSGADPVPVFHLPQRPAPRLSVLTLSYNHAAFIEENIKSVIAQKTDFPVQHIIADDGSRDGTQDIILAYAEKHPHIIPMLNRKRAQRSNVRILFDMARSPYVALCDGDDYFTDPLKLQTQADFLDANPACSLCFHPVQVVYEDGTRRSRVHPPPDALPRGVRQFYYLADLLRFNMIQTNSVMYRWRFTQGLPDWFRPDLVPGDWYWHLLHAELGKIGFIDKVMSVYRRHKKGVYYLAEVDRLKHRAAVGKRELEMYDAVNRHFHGKYESILLDMTNGVFADCLLHDSENGDEGGTKTLDALCERFPSFARHFLASLKKAGRGR